MNPERLLALYDRIADAPDAVPRLRRFILDLAVRGKLVEQDPNDEPASELLKRIGAEKARLVKAGGLRNTQTRSVRMATTPFALPMSWKWAALGELFLYDAGIKRDPKVLDGQLWLLELEDIEKESGRLLVRVNVSERDSRSTKSEFRVDDILYGKLRPYLNKVLVADRPGYSTTEIVAIRPYLALCSRYCALALRRPDFVDYVTRLGQGTKMPRLRTEDAKIAPFPLPPLTEQRRIVAKVDELTALCDRLEAARAKREARRGRLTTASLARLNGPAPDPAVFRQHVAAVLENLTPLTQHSDQIKALRQTILNLAVRGRLAEQDPDDEPASEFLKRIAADRVRSEKSGSVKRQLSMPPVDALDGPFGLKPGWTWARFPEVGKFGRGKSRHRPRNDPLLFDDGKYPFVQTGDVARSTGEIETYSNLYNDVGLAQSAMWPAGTLCITIAANIADSGILAFDACFPDSIVGLVVHDAFENAQYFEYFIRTVKNNLREFAPSTAQKNINLGILAQVLIPLPPLAEQRRIVAKINELMVLCDGLDMNLATGADARRRLLDALPNEALEPTVARPARYARDN